MLDEARVRELYAETVSSVPRYNDSTNEESDEPKAWMSIGMAMAYGDVLGKDHTLVLEDIDAYTALYLLDDPEALRQWNEGSEEAS